VDTQQPPTERRGIRIVARGTFSERLDSFFGGLTVARREGATVLVGEIADQSQLHRLLARIRELGLDLQAVLLTDLPATASH
jgi:uncharacterized membrane protein